MSDYEHGGHKLNMKVFAVLSVLCIFPLSHAYAASSWSGGIKCSYGSGSLSLTVDDAGNVAGGVTNGKVKSGRVAGSSVSFTTSNFMGNKASFTGTMSGNSMAGTYSQSANGETCTWFANKTGSGPSKAIAKKPADDPNSEACRNVRQAISTAAKVKTRIARLSKSAKDQLRRCSFATDGYNDLEQISAAHCPSQRSSLKSAMAQMNNLLCTQREYESYQRQLYQKDGPIGGGVRG